MNLFYLNLFLLCRRRVLSKKSLEIAFRAQEKRWNRCFGQIVAVDYDMDEIPIEVREEIREVHERLMKITKDAEWVEGIDIKTQVRDKVTETNTDEFYGQWNRSTEFVLAYQEIFGGQDPELLAEAEEWKKAHPEEANF